MNDTLRNTTRFVVLVLLQILIFNNIGYLGYINPMIYILFIMLYPHNENKISFLFASFLIGLCVDIFSNTGGLHAAAGVFIAYVRSSILLFVFGKNFDFQDIRLLQYPFTKVFIYVSFLTLLHHILFYFLEIFNFNHLLDTFVKIGVSSAFTIIICLLSIYIFSNKK